MGIRDGFRFGLGLWFATMLVGTAWMVIMLLITMSIVG